MTADEFAKQLYSINGELLLSNYEEIIIRWLKQYPTMTAAQVCDCEIQTGTYVEPIKDNFGDWLLKWLEAYKNQI